MLHQYQARAEARPDVFVRYEYRTRLLDESRKIIADYLHAPVDTCVLVPNTSTGIDSVLRNLIFAPGDVIICFPTIYGSFDNTIEYLTETTPVSSRKIEYTYPVSDDHIYNAFKVAVEEMLTEGKKPKLALFDTVVSLPGIRMPFERLTELCRAYNILSCIDGAHGVGQIPLDLPDLDPDFFVSNCHKWLHVPRGCAVLYVPIRNQHFLRATLPTGFKFFPLSKRKENGEHGNFVANFASVGTLDDTPYLCIAAALEWRKHLTWGKKKGEEAIVGYIHNLARTGGRTVSAILGTEVLGGEEDTSRGYSMTNVRLPLSMVGLRADCPAGSDEISLWIMKIMNLEYHTAVQVFQYADAWWVRLSAQVYLTLRDFERAGLALKETCAKVDRGDWGQR